MAAALYQPESFISKPIVGRMVAVENLVVEDLIEEVAPDMQFADSMAFHNIYTVLQAALNSVATACHDMATLPAVIASERRRVVFAGQDCLSAFDLFVSRIGE